MGLLKRLFEFYINSSIHVSIAVCCLCLVTLINEGQELDTDLIFFIFFASITGYNFIKYFGVAKFHHRRLAGRLKQIQIFSFLCFIGLVYFTFDQELRTLIYFGVFAALSFFYAVPFLPKRMLLDSRMNLRAISGLKIYIIAFVWGGITVVIPLINSGGLIDLELILIFIQRYLYIIVATLPFEIRDMQFDNLKLATIPQKIGIGFTKKIGTLLLVLFCAVEFLKDESTTADVVAVFIVAIITLILLLNSKIDQSKYYSSFWVEAVPVLWLALLFF
jgi:hypothetical protein